MKLEYRHDILLNEFHETFGLQISKVYSGHYLILFVIVVNQSAFFGCVSNSIVISPFILF